MLIGVFGCRLVQWLLLLTPAILVIWRSVALFHPSSGRAVLQAFSLYSTVKTTLATSTGVIDVHIWLVQCHDSFCSLSAERQARAGQLAAVFHSIICRCFNPGSHLCRCLLMLWATILRCPALTHSSGRQHRLDANTNFLCIT